MPRATLGFMIGLFALPCLAGPGLGQGVAAPSARWTVVERELDDLKAVFATVRSKDRIEARVRTAGTVVTLKVTEGAHVAAGQVLALVADPKIALGIKALDARIVGAESRLKNAKVRTRARRTAQGPGRHPAGPRRSAENRIRRRHQRTQRGARRGREPSRRTRRVSEGEVLAPAAGRILKVPVTEGSVVMAGESIATIAANQYVLRLELPERHARFMKVGDLISTGARGLAVADQASTEGRITMVYPELQGGRVLADADLAGLGDYFVGERVKVWISAGKRRTIVVPAEYTFKRFGLD